MSEALEGRQRARWPWISLAPLGLGAWAPILAGARAGRRSWIALGGACSLITLGGWVAAITAGSGTSNVGGLLLIAGWVSAIAVSFSIRPAYDRQMASPLAAALETGELALKDRAQARAIAQRNPALAQEIGIGRPDRPGAADAGLVDINNASVTALLTLPGVDGDLATQIIETRKQVHGFDSLEDMGEALDLDGHTVEDLRGRALFLPRVI